MTLVEDDRGILSTKFNLGELKDRPKSEKRHGLDFAFILYTYSTVSGRVPDCFALKHFLTLDPFEKRS